jgi:hypothetical protein
VPAPTLSAPNETSAASELAEAWREAGEASLRYWGTLGRLAFESIRVIAPLAAELRPTGAATNGDPVAAALPKTILVEAEAGQSGLGVFLVENTTDRQLSLPVSVSPFHDPEGREVEPKIAFRPDEITLDPGDQQVVQVAAAVDEGLEPGVRYQALISLPGLSETRIPIVVRRRTSAAQPSKRKAKAAARSS